MKKIILLINLLLLVGCSKKTVCLKEIDNEKINITIKSVNNNIKNINIKSIFKNDEEASNYCTLLNLSNIKVECNNNIIIYENYKDFLDININKENDLIEYLKSNNYNCK